MMRTGLTLTLALCLGTLAGCDSTPSAKDVEKLDAELAKQKGDPAFNAAIDGQIMVDPQMAQATNAGKVRAGDRPASAPYPDAPGNDRQTLGQAASKQASGSFGGCNVDVDYDLRWANKLPAGLPLYPQARLVEAAGSDKGDCRLRAVNFTAKVPMATLVAYYKDAATRAGYTADYRVEKGEHMVGGTRADGGAYYLILAESNGTTSVDLVANKGV